MRNTNSGLIIGLRSMVPMVFTMPAISIIVGVESSEYRAIHLQEAMDV